MKLIDKLKNALFEEEYVEVEEKPKRKEIKKEKKIKEPRIKERTIKEKPEEKVEEKPIAKKIVQEEKESKKEEVVTNQDEHLGESLAYKKELEKDFKFPMVSDSEFAPEDYLEEQPKKAKKFKKFPSLEKPLYQGKKKTDNKPYGLDELDLQEHEYGAYEKKEERTYFKPSPIISPIYGILDKNYTKDDIIPKKEIRLTSSYARENMNVDDVRQKAFGTLENDLKKEIEDIDIYEDNEEEDNNFLDLSSDTKTPEVNKVTVGDAEEYFEDLGLEYNVDYTDTSIEKASGRRTKEDYDKEDEEIIDADDTYDINEEVYDEELDEELQEEIEERSEVKISDSNELEEQDDEDNDDDNLFDLIDSMYDKE